MKNSTKNLLLIFTRNLELGKCKTRLAKKIGDEAALEIYKFLLEHTVRITKDLKAKKQTFYSEEIWENDIWNNELYLKKLQVGKTLGERMANAFMNGFKVGYERIIIIGSDMYDLSQKDLEAAFDALEQHDFVIGPATDGGYYLLGMKKFKPELFQNKDWGKETVFQSTLADLIDDDIYLLPEKNDVDIYEDIAHIEAFQPFLKHLKK